ncbi:MAG: glycosyltransferase family 1 protein [Sphingobacteriaceae bacterium]|nr:MAG: glycosyltransferase family 1 protein [Sphingobacteriaceae bacterium]
MQILIFTTVFFPLRGGIENLTLNLCRQFIEKGHEVKVIAYQKQSEVLPDIEVYYAPGFAKMMELFSWCKVYYMPNISLRGTWPLLFSPRKRWIISQNDFSLTNKKNLLSLFKLFLIKFSSENISVSKSIATSLGTPSEIIYNCYDDVTFKTNPQAQRRLDFVFVGRLVTQKGCDTLIRACQNLNLPFKLTIIGDGPEMYRLQALAQQLKLTDSIVFTGTLKSPEIVEILNQHKTMIIPSHGKEGFGIVALEGLACGCQVIASDSGGLAEAVGSFGKLFQPGNVQQLNGLLKDALLNTNQPDYKPEELEAYLNDYKTPVVAQKYLSVFGSAA